MEAPDKTMEIAAGYGGVGYPTEHLDGVDSATTENGKHPRREYDKVESEASERGQASVGPATGEDSHGDTTHSAGRTQEEEGDKNPGMRARSGSLTAEKRRRGAPPNGRAHLTQAAAKGGRGNPHPSVCAHGAQ